MFDRATKVVFWAGWVLMAIAVTKWTISAIIIMQRTNVSFNDAFIATPTGYMAPIGLVLIFVSVIVRYFVYGTWRFLK
jgi:hypothetical protein